MATSIQYPYAYDEKNNLIFIGDVDRETRREHRYRCPNCGEIMEPRMGEHNAWHFAHANHKCGVESYIHKTAKMIIANSFNDSKTPFIVRLRFEPICKNYETCQYFDDSICHKSYYSIEREYDLKQYYTLPAQVESDVADIDRHYRPDILLRSPDPKRSNIFLEIRYKHKSDKEKISSGHPIIEISISRMEDLRSLEERRVFSYADSDVNLYGFKPLFPTKNDIKEIIRGQLGGGPVEYYLLPKCLWSKANLRHEYHLQRFTLYSNGRRRIDGIYEHEIDQHDTSAILDITYDRDKLSLRLDFDIIIAQKYRPCRTCHFCHHRITKCGAETAWGDIETMCDLMKNGSTENDTFDEQKGSYCVFFEWARLKPYLGASFEKAPIEGTDYVVWVNPTATKN